MSINFAQVLINPNMQLTENQILGLAPDAATAKAGNDLAAAIAKWKNTGYDETAIWGECQGSGKDAYKTQIDRAGNAFKCSCPSRKFPCKHGIGLYLLYMRNTALFATAKQPVWVQEWIDKRLAKAEKDAQPETPEANAEKAAKQAKDKEKRATQRADKVQNGLADLEKWLKDLINGGWLQLPAKPHSFWNEKAARLVDAQAPNLAMLVRNLKHINYTAPDWQIISMRRLSQIYLIAQAYGQLTQLPPNLQADIKALIGWTIKKEELSANPNALRLDDTWLVCSKRLEEDTEQQLSTQYIWLYGQQSQQYALLLDFATPYNPFTLSLPIGTAQKATLCFYPSAAPLRAILLPIPQQNLPFAYPSHLYSHFTEMGNAYAQRLAQQPFADKIPFWVRQIGLAQHQNRWYARDAQQQYLPLHTQYNAIYRHLALSGGQSCDMCLVYWEQQILPLGIWVNHEYFVLE